MGVNPDLHLKQWLIEDIRLTLVMDTELRQEAGEPVIEDAKRAELERLREDLRADCGDRPTAMPSAKDRAGAIGAPLLYSLAYRCESKSGIHPTTLAAEQLIRALPEVGKYEIREEPPDDLELPDAEGVSTWLLAAIMEAAQALVPELPMDEGFKEVQAEILKLRPGPPSAR